MIPLVTSLLIGAGLGAALGHFGKCTSGSCPLTANWRRGAVYGAAVGLMFHFALGRTGSGSADESTPHVTQLASSDFEAQVLAATQPVLIDFYAPWCGPCKVLSPRLEKIAETLAGRVKFVKVNVDQAGELARQFNIQGVPTLVFFSQGKEVDRIVGLPPGEALEQRLQALATSKSQALLP